MSIHLLFGGGAVDTTNVFIIQIDSGMPLVFERDRDLGRQKDRDSEKPGDNYKRDSSFCTARNLIILVFW